jgi:hypothetical protein
MTAVDNLEPPYAFQMSKAAFEDRIHKGSKTGKSIVTSGGRVPLRLFAGALRVPNPPRWARECFPAQASAVLGEEIGPPPQQERWGGSVPAGAAGKGGGAAGQGKGKGKGKGGGAAGKGGKGKGGKGKGGAAGKGGGAAGKGKGKGGGAAAIAVAAPYALEAGPRQDSCSQAISRHSDTL